MSALPRPPSPAWQAALREVARLDAPDAAARYARLVAAVRGREGRPAFDAVLASIRAPEDHGVYEAAHDALWRFPVANVGAWLAAALPDLQRRMGRHDQVQRFYGPLTTRPRARAAFVAAVVAMPAAGRRRVIAIVRGWAREEASWEPVLAALGAPVAAPSARAPAPTAWPPAWQRLLDDVRAGRRPIVAAWGSGNYRARLPLVIALLTADLGPRWREVDALTNPLFLSYAKACYPAFVAAVAALPAAEQKRLLAALGRAAPRKRAALQADLR